MKKFPLKKWLPNQLQQRLLLIVVAPMVLLQSIALWVFFDRNWDTMTKKLSLALVQDIGYAIHLLNSTPPQQQKEVLNYFAQAHSLRIDMHPKEHALTPQSSRDFFWGSKRFLARDITRHIERPFMMRVSDNDDRLHIFLALPQGVMEVSFDEGRLYSSTTLLFVLFTFLSVGILSFAAFSLARNQARPIIRLAHAMDEFGKGIESAFPPQLSGSAETRLAIKAFAAMRQRIHQQINEREQMLTAISHDLNTAVSRMKLSLALKNDKERYERIQLDIHDIERIIEDYLAVLRAQETEQAVSLPVRQLWTQLCALFPHHAITHDESAHSISVRPKQFKRCLVNIVDNATHYSGRIHLSSRKSSKGQELIIDDDGIGIAKKERERVFDPFYRLEPSRNRTTGGLGLGMSIARDIMHSHKGSIRLEDSPLGGLRVRLTLPL